MNDRLRKSIATPNQCAVNVVLCFIGISFLMGMNFVKIVMPTWLLLGLMVIPFLFSLMSFAAFVYWIYRYWDHYDGGERVLKLMGIVVLSFIVLMPGYVVYRIALHAFR